MRKTPTITMNHIQTAASTFEDFLRTKRTNGVKTKSLETYAQHFRSISKHLELLMLFGDKPLFSMERIISFKSFSVIFAMSTVSYTITLKAFFSWCNNEGLTLLNMKKYKGEDTVKETYSDDELLSDTQKQKRWREEGTG